MVKAGEFDDAVVRTRPEEERDGKRAMVAGAPEGGADRNVRVFGGDKLTSAANKNMCDAVPSPLFALAHIVQQRRGDKVRVGVAAFQKPAGGSRGVDDIARVLVPEDFAEGGREVCRGEREIASGRNVRSGEELVDATAHQTSRLKMESRTPPISHARGE